MITCEDVGWLWLHNIQSTLCTHYNKSDLDVRYENVVFNSLYVLKFKFSLCVTQTYILY